ncbi:MAG: XRE family transcriptional regulator [Pirellulaceae bacterium]
MPSKTQKNDESPQQFNASVEPLHQHVSSKIKELRQRRKWTLEHLARVSGVSRSMLSQVERGAANPTLAVAFRIAQAFDLSLGDLVKGAFDQPRIEVIRHDDQESIFREDEIGRIRTLSPLNLEKDVEFYEVVLRPGQCLSSAPHFEGTREFLTVVKGAVVVISGEETTTLKKGDSAQYPADVEHSIENQSKVDATLFLVDIYARQL